MARITVEDCMERVDNRFDLVLMTSIRSKQLKRGARRLLKSENRDVVTSLREIASGYIEADPMEEEVSEEVEETSE